MGLADDELKVVQNDLALAHLDWLRAGRFIGVSVRSFGDFAHYTDRQFKCVTAYCLQVKIGYNEACNDRL